MFPQAAAIDFKAPAGWEGTEFLTTLPRTWNETGPLDGTIRRDEDSDEQSGPLTLGISLTREIESVVQTMAAKPNASGAIKAPPENPDSIQQRVVVIGDGDFLSNAYLGNGGNLNLGLNIFNWLSHDDSFIAIPAKTSPDTSLNLSNIETGIIGLGFLVALPLILLGSGLIIWLKRRKR